MATVGYIIEINDFQRKLLSKVLRDAVGAEWQPLVERAEMSEFAVGLDELPVLQDISAGEICIHRMFE